MRLQDNLEVPSKEELEDLDAQIGELQEEATRISDEAKALSQGLLGILFRKTTFLKRFRDSKVP